jgi:predicted lipoprotein with Yx(FWY)xxD motif
VKRKLLVLLPASLLIGGLTVWATAGGPTPASSQGFLKVAFNSALEKEIVVDGDGRTVYMFARDTRGIPTCTAQLPGHPLCPKVLPPVTGAPSAGAGIDASKLGATERADGRRQITYNRHPLYYFRGGLGFGAPDRKPGDINGQGFFEMFHVLSPQGTPIRTP